MKVKAKSVERSGPPTFSHLGCGEVYRLSHSTTNASMWMKIEEEDSDNCVRLEDGMKGLTRHDQEVFPVTGAFVEE